MTILRHLPKLAVMALLITTPGCAPENINKMKRGVEVVHLGSVECGSLNADRTTSPDHSEKLNWTLGFLSGLAVSKQENYLEGRTAEQLAVMITKKCQEKPFNSLGTVAYEIERELLSQEK